MDKILNVIMHDQPDQTTCGPTSLHCVYSFYNDDVELKAIVDDIKQFDEGGGTLSVVLGRHALTRGYDVKLYSYNINIFDPSWFESSSQTIIENLTLRLKRPEISSKEVIAISEYIKFLKEGGELLFEDLSISLLQRLLNQGIPILAGLSSTWLYRSQRENPLTCEDDPINGEPAGHFVVMNGLTSRFEAMIADPYKKNPLGETNYYSVSLSRLMNAILLGISTYDGNLLIIRKK